MSAAEVLRLTWTAVGAVGSLAGLAAVAVAVWLLRDSRRDEDALKQVRPDRLNILRLLSRTEVSDMRKLCVAIGLLGLALGMQCGSGVAAMFAEAEIAISLLVGAEVMGVASMITLLVLGVSKVRHRRSLFSAVRAPSTGVRA